MEIFPYFAWPGLEALDDTPDTSRFSIIMVIIMIATYELSITNKVQSQPTIKNFQAKPQQTGQS